MSKTLKFSYANGVMIKEDCPYHKELLDCGDKDVERTPKIGSAACSSCSYHETIDMIKKYISCNADEFIAKPIPLTRPLIYSTNNNIFKKSFLNKIK